MSDAMDIATFEDHHLCPEVSLAVRQLAEIKEAVNPTYLDWLKFRDNGCIDLDISVLRLARIWSHLGDDKPSLYSFGASSFRAENIQGTFFQYEVEVPLELVRKALAVLVKTGLLVREGRSYRAVNPGL